MNSEKSIDNLMGLFGQKQIWNDCFKPGTDSNLAFERGDLCGVVGLSQRLSAWLEASHCQTPALKEQLQQGHYGDLLNALDSSCENEQAHNSLLVLQRVTGAIDNRAFDQAAKQLEQLIVLVRDKAFSEAYSPLVLVLHAIQDSLKLARQKHYQAAIDKLSPTLLEYPFDKETSSFVNGVLNVLTQMRVVEQEVPQKALAESLLAISEIGRLLLGYPVLISQLGINIKLSNAATATHLAVKEKNFLQALLSELMFLQTFSSDDFQYDQEIIDIQKAINLKSAAYSQATLDAFLINAAFDSKAFIFKHVTLLFALYQFSVALNQTDYEKAKQILAQLDASAMYSSFQKAMFRKMDGALDVRIQMLVDINAMGFDAYANELFQAFSATTP